jgi:Curli production assembly/transport component CsgG.
MPAKIAIRYLLLALIFSSCFAPVFSAAPQDTTHSQTNIAVLDLEPRGGLSASEIESISDRLRGELISTGKYVVLERSQMDAILKEQGFQQTGVCSEASCIVQVGQLLAVHKMVGGSIGLVGKAFSVNLKVIDVATGKIERQYSDDFRCSKEDLVTIHIRNMARDMAGIQRLKSSKKLRMTIKWGGYGLGVVTGLVAGYFAYTMNDDYKKYKAATEATTAKDYWSQFSKDQTATIITGTVAGVLLATGVVFTLEF